MKISIVCPLYNASKYIQSLHESILSQDLKENFELEVLYILTKSKDNSKEILEQNKLNYIEILPEEFSHSKTREKAASKLSCDVLVFISQDIIIKNTDWLDNLVTPIINGECAASFSKQVCEYENIEKYTRLNNYPEKSRLMSSEDIEQYGLITFFYSDASSAISKKVYDSLGAYDNKDLIINEDMYLAYKLINNKYKIKYCADSIVYHSHEFTLKQLFQRYFDTGVFFADNAYFLNYGSNVSGLKLAKFILKQSVKDKEWLVAGSILPNFGARFLGKFLGQKYKKLPKGVRKNFSSFKYYWNRNE